MSLTVPRDRKWRVAGERQSIASKMIPLVEIYFEQQDLDSLATRMQSHLEAYMMVPRFLLLGVVVGFAAEQKRERTRRGKSTLKAEFSL